MTNSKLRTLNGFVVAMYFRVVSFDLVLVSLVEIPIGTGPAFLILLWLWLVREKQIANDL
jgi:hypothetical protein